MLGSSGYPKERSEVYLSKLNVGHPFGDRRRAASREVGRQRVFEKPLSSISDGDVDHTITLERCSPSSSVYLRTYSLLISQRQVLESKSFPLCSSTSRCAFLYVHSQREG